MASKIAERSGRAVTEYLDLIGFRPSQIFIVGLGTHPGEVGVFQEVWPDSKIFAWEANPLICDGLVNFPGVFFRYAISDKAGMKPLYFRHSWKSGSSLYQPHHDKKTTVEMVQAKPLDDFSHLVDCNEMGLLWLDCEGSELDALKGGRRFITERVGAINIEMTGKPRGLDWPSPLKVHNELLDLGFYQVWVHTIRTVIGQWDAIYVRRKWFKPEFCCCPDSLRFVQSLDRDRMRSEYDRYD